MPAPAGYVGYTVTQTPVFKTCVANHINNQYAPTQKAVIAAARAKYGAAGFSLFEYIVVLNNLNGGRPVPAGHVIVARVAEVWSRQEPCGVQRAPHLPTFYFEKFGANPTNFCFFLTGCKSQICYQRVVEYAIMPDPAPATPIRAKEYAARINLTAAQQAAFTAAGTLQFNMLWNYDNCNNPPRTPHNKKHSFDFTAKTFDPTVQPARNTWTLPGRPLHYHG